MKITRTRIGFSADDGFSLAEVMTVSILLGVILAAAYLAMGTVNRVSDGMMARSAAQTQGQSGLETMSRELRQAQIINNGPGGQEHLHTLTATVVSFYTDIDHDGLIERVTYTASGGYINRTVARSNKAAPYPSDFGADGTPTKLCTVDPTDTTFFRYTDAGTVSTPPAFTAIESQVRAVLIDLATVAKSADQSVTVNFPTTEIDVRAFANQ